MKTFKFEVTQTVIVQIDEAKLAPLMAEFNSSITDFGTGDEACERHAQHIAKLVGTGVQDFEPNDFVEGYGKVAEAGIDVGISNTAYCERIGGVF